MEFRHDPDPTRPGEGRYVLAADGGVVAIAEYHERDGRRIFSHTEVDPALQGQGLASRLVRAALDQERSDGRTIVPTCGFVRAWIGRHPEYDDLVDHAMLATYTRRSHG